MPSFLVRLSFIVAMLTLIGCEKPSAKRGETTAAPVTVAKVGKKTVPVRVKTIGSVKAFASVAIRPRVGGQLTEVFFQEGDIVRTNQKLFTIDPRPYDAAVKQAEANKARSDALLKGAELDLARAEQVRENGVGSATDYDAALTAVASARATVEADQAAINTAKLQASFTTITSPLDGRAGEMIVDQGNLVDANSANPLVVINQVSPIYVTFSLPEQQLPDIIAARQRGPVTVVADLRGGVPLASGVLSFVDNATDPLTGTIQFKAEFENAEQKLLPGLFVEVTVTLGSRPGSVVIPSAALQSGQNGQYVYIVGSDNKAELKPVTVAFEADGEAIIATGLTGGETVVVEGQLRLAPGTKVDAKPYQPPPAINRTQTPNRVILGGAQ